MAGTLEPSDHTSVQRRIEGLVDEPEVAGESVAVADGGGGVSHDGRSRRSTIFDDADRGLFGAARLKSPMERGVRDRRLVSETPWA